MRFWWNEVNRSMYGEPLRPFQGTVWCWSLRLSALRFRIDFLGFARFMLCVFLAWHSHLRHPELRVFLHGMEFRRRTLVDLHEDGLESGHIVDRVQD